MASRRAAIQDVHGALILSTAPTADRHGPAGLTEPSGDGYCRLSGSQVLFWVSTEPHCIVEGEPAWGVRCRDN
jgi:hypothetical protein